jgi:hypothetical protein
VDFGDRSVRCDHRRGALMTGTDNLIEFELLIAREGTQA